MRRWCFNMGQEEKIDLVKQAKLDEICNTRYNIWYFDVHQRLQNIKSPINKFLNRKEYSVPIVAIYLKNTKCKIYN